ncbi:MAG: sulfatase-like hydrolase/transferase [Kiritimatiellales bacterium]
MAAGMFFLPQAGTCDPSEKPNIILILADDLGYGDIGPYGCRDIHTPNLDRLAASGICLTSGYVTHPYCGPSRAGIMTGRYQQSFGFWRNPPILPKSRSVGLDTEEETLGDVMTRAGYRTAAFGKWHLSASEMFHPNNRGFHEFYGFLSGGHHYFPVQYADQMKRWANQAPPPAGELYGYATPLEFNGINLPPQEGYLSDLLTSQAISFMRNYKDRPLFLYMAYNAPHTPLEAPKKYIEKYNHIPNEKRRNYAAMVDNLDWNIGRLIAELDKLEKRENTLIVFLSDNGGPCSQNGSSNGSLRDGKGCVAEGGVHVPFIFNWPSRLPQGGKVDVPISSLDLLPTFAALAGVGPAGQPLDGTNVWPWLLGRTDDVPHKRLFWGITESHQMGMREGNLKLLRMGENKPWELFNLSEDIGEKNDLSEQMPESLKTMEKEYLEWLSPMPPERWSGPGK